MAKATVQAALGPLVFKYLSEDDEEGLRFGEILLMLCVLSIVVTAPTGAILISITGTKLLTKTKIPTIPDSKLLEIKFSLLHIEFIHFNPSFKLVSTWRRPSIRSIAIEEEDDDDYDKNDPEMAPDKNTLSNTLSNRLNTVTM